MKTHHNIFIITLGIGLLSNCGGNSDTSTNPPQASRADAIRFLEQSSFGPNETEIAKVQAIGIPAYLNNQFSQPATGYQGTLPGNPNPIYGYVPPTPLSNCTFDPANTTSTASLCNRDNYSLFQVQLQFFRNALTGSDQLRQRVAFALSQILVVSGGEINLAYGMADYQNMLLNQAFGNYRDLLMSITTSPVMGNYLDMVNNDGANPAISPNENYARELLQLFSIGLNQLNIDGSLQTDNQGKPIPTYDENVIIGFAKLFTGWTYPVLSGATDKWTNPINYDGVMELFPTHHSTTSKTLLNGVIVPAGQTGQQDLNSAIDNIFNHPNIGPFVGKQLIQHLVTSNPSPAYVARVAAVFNNDGKGVRGNMQAVVQAILLDTEARGDTVANTSTPSMNSYGYLREPALFLTTFMRNLGGQSDGQYLRNIANNLGQSIYNAPSVFNYYPPSYKISVNNLFGPEFAILNAPTEITHANFIYQMIYANGLPADTTVIGSIGTFVDLSGLEVYANNADTLVDQLNQQMLHGRLSSNAHAIITQAVNTLPSANLTARVQMAVYLIATSQQYQVVQ